jgi:hypothetical protein
MEDPRDRQAVSCPDIPAEMSFADMRTMSIGTERIFGAER